VRVNFPRLFFAVFFAILLSLPVSASVGSDRRLAELAVTLARLPAARSEDDPTRGARPELTTAKHQLRDWIGFQLKTGNFADANRNSAKTITHYLKRSLKAAGMSSFGISVWRSGPLVVVSTSFGIVCGRDDSLYGWLWGGHSWMQSFTYERNDYSGKYKPLSLDSVRLVADDARPTAGYYVLASSVGSWCSSNWLGRMYQLIHVDGTTGRADFLADEDLFAFVAEGERETELSSAQAVIKYTGSTGDERKAPMQDTLVMYMLSNGRATRVSMAAADVEDYAEKWLSAPQVTGTRSALAPWWQVLHAYMAEQKASMVGHSSTGPAGRCSDDPKLWQFPMIFERTPVTASFPGHSTVASAPSESHAVYFLIHEDDRYRFSMQGIRATPRKNCPVPTEE
jgi:hypothetical protein